VSSDESPRGVGDPVTLATFVFLPDAYVLRSRLEYEGIPCFIPEENHGSIMPGGTAMVIRVMVNREDLEAARKVMADVSPESEGD